jgi:hypothetical protein
MEVDITRIQDSGAGVEPEILIAGMKIFVREW